MGILAIAMRSAGRSTDRLRVVLRPGSSHDGMNRRSEEGSKLVAMVHGKETWRQLSNHAVIVDGVSVASRSYGARECERRPLEFVVQCNSNRD
jgi:hypothetical protein